MWQSSESSGSNNTEYLETKLTADGGLVIDSKGPVVAEVMGGSSLLRKAVTPAKAGAQEITFLEQHNQHQSWDESQSGLTQAGSFLVGGLASIATMGAASGLSQAMVLGANASSSAIAAATTFQTMQIGAISAGLTSAASTIAVGAINGSEVRIFHSSHFDPEGI